MERDDKLIERSGIDHFTKKGGRFVHGGKQTLNEKLLANESKLGKKEALQREKCKRDCFFELVIIKQKLKFIEEQEFTFTPSANRSRIREKIANLVRQYEIDLQKCLIQLPEVEEIYRALKAISQDLDSFYKKCILKEKKSDLVERAAVLERGKKQFQTKVELFMCRLDQEEKCDGGVQPEEPPIPMKPVNNMSSREGVISAIYASNVNEDWERLETLFLNAVREGADLILLTQLFGNPLDSAEQSAYKHAFQAVKEAYVDDHTFSDIQEFINSFRGDCSQDIVAVSARKILQHIEYGKEVLAVKVSLLKKILCRYRVKALFIPGPYENVDLIGEIDSYVAAHYLSVSKSTFKGVHFLGVGGQPLLIDRCPLFFQNRDYFEGTEQADEELGELIKKNVDVLISYTPIKFFTDSEVEERNIRPYLCRYLPGKVILTSQELSKQPEASLKTATDAELLKGGFFGQREGGGPCGFYWKLFIGKEGLQEKALERIGE